MSRGQTTFHERAVTVTRRLAWVVFVVAILLIGASLWIGAFRLPAPASLLERYGGIGIGVALASNAALALLPPKHRSRWALWSLCAAGSLLAIANFWLKVSR